MDKRLFRFVHAQARKLAAELCMTVPDGWIAVFSEPTRTLDQNADQWPYLQGFADQLQWPVNGQMVWMTKEEWKDVLTAAFEQETVRLAQGLNGGVVMLGSRTSHFGQKKFREWMEFLRATAALKGVEPVYANARPAIIHATGNLEAAA